MPKELPIPTPIDALWKNNRDLDGDRIKKVLVGDDEKLKKQELQDIVDYCVHDDTNILMMMGGIELACRLCVEVKTRKYGQELLREFDKYLRENEVTVKLYYDRLSGSAAKEFVEEHLPILMDSIVYHLQNHKSHIPISEASTPALDKAVGVGLELAKAKDRNTDQVLVITRRNEGFTDEFVQLEEYLTKLMEAARSSSALAGEAESMIAFYDVIDLLSEEKYRPVEAKRVVYQGRVPRIVSGLMTPLADFKRYIDRAFLRQEKSYKVGLNDVLEAKTQDRFNQLAMEFLVNAPTGDRLWADIVQSVFFTPVVFDEDIREGSVFSRRELQGKVFGFQEYLAERIWKLATDPAAVDAKTRIKIEQIIDSQVFMNQFFMAKTVMHAVTHQQWFRAVLGAEEPVEHGRVVEMAAEVNTRYVALKANWPAYRANLAIALRAEDPRAYQIRQFIKALDFVFDPEQIVDVPMQTTDPVRETPPPEVYLDYKTYFTIGKSRGFQGAVGVPETKRVEAQTARANLETLTVQAAKGDAFEQLAGCVLGLMEENLQEPLVPQFAINRKYNADGTVKFASRRIDFATRNGRRVYEVKWGNAKGEIVETLERDLPLVETAEIDEYYLVTFKKKTDRKMGALQVRK